MPIIEDAKQTAQRFSTYIQQLIDLFKRFDIVGSRAPLSLWKSARNSEFRKEWKRIWIEIAERDGGKLTLTTVLGVIGAVLGGVGIAALGGAVGVPLALLLAPVGYLIGNEVDAAGLLGKIKAYLAGSPEAVVESPQPTSDVEQLTGLVSDLLARSEKHEGWTIGVNPRIGALETRMTESDRSAAVLRSDLLARCEQAESLARVASSRIEATERSAREAERAASALRPELSALFLRCEGTEALVRGADSRTEAVEARLLNAEGDALALRSEVSRLERRIKYLGWSGAVLAVLLIAHLAWDVILRGVK